MAYEDSLPPAFSEFLAQSVNSRYFDYYTGPFSHFENLLLKKHSVHTDVVALRNVLTSTQDVLLEIGAGSGRVTKELFESCRKDIALEKSSDSFRHLRERFADKCEVLNEDFFKFHPRQGERVDGVVMGSLSINLFLEQDVDNFLEHCDRILPKNGAVYFGCFDRSSVIDFEKYTGKVGSSMTLEDYIDEEDQSRLMISNTMYLKDEQYLMQNWFVDMHGSTMYPQFCFSALIEKIWTLDTLQPYFDSWGFALLETSEFRIEGGGGDGLLARMCKLARA